MTLYLNPKSHDLYLLMDDGKHVFKFEFIPVSELPDGAMDLYSFNPVGERKIIDGRVTESSRIIYSLSEQDIISVAEERELEITPEQRGSTAPGLVFLPDPNHQWDGNSVN